MVFLGFPMVFPWFFLGAHGFPNSVDFLKAVESPVRNMLQGWRAFGQISGSQVDVQNNGIASVGEDSDTNYLDGAMGCCEISSNLIKPPCLLVK